MPALWSLAGASRAERLYDQLDCSKVFLCTDVDILRYIPRSRRPRIKREDLSRFLRGRSERHDSAFHQAPGFYSSKDFLTDESTLRVHLCRLSWSWPPLFVAQRAMAHERPSLIQDQHLRRLQPSRCSLKSRETRKIQFRNCRIFESEPCLLISGSH